LVRNYENPCRYQQALVGERVGIRVFEDGHVEYSRFYGNEDIEDDALLLKVLLFKHRAR
jgi:hypothetical protein